MGTLFIVATPIGNLKDITLRAKEILSKVNYIACEDTRRTGMLLHNVILSPQDEESRSFASAKDDTEKKLKLISYYEQNELQRIPYIIELLKNGSDVALVSDAGTPTISDPGFKLVRECINQGIKVEPIPGPSSVTTALVISGLPTDKFLFVGYPPKKQGHRQKLFNELTKVQHSIKVTVIMLEAPHRLVKTLQEMMDVFGDMNIVIARELTKIHEEVRREKISQSLTHFEKTNPKGEFVIIFNYGK